MNSVHNHKISVLIFFVLFLFIPNEPVHAENPKNYFRIGWELQAEGKYSRSIPYLREYVKKNPFHEESAYFLALGLIFQEILIDPALYRKDCLEAASILKKNIPLYEYELSGNLAPETSRRYFYMGLALWFAGRSDLAKSSFQDALKYDPSRKEGEYNIQMIEIELNQH